MNINEIIGYILIILASLALVSMVFLMIVEYVQNSWFQRTYERNFVKRANELRSKEMLETLDEAMQSLKRIATDSSTNSIRNVEQKSRVTAKAA